MTYPDQLLTAVADRPGRARRALALLQPAAAPELRATLEKIAGRPDPDPAVPAELPVDPVVHALALNDKPPAEEAATESRARARSRG